MIDIYNIILIAVVVFVIISIIWYWFNYTIEIENYEIEHEKIPEDFNNYKIVQLSDLHNKEFGKDNNRLITKVKELQPDIIVVTGDIIDRRRFWSREKGFKILEQLVKICPVYYILGNHEWWSGNAESIIKRARAIGITVLNDESIQLTNHKSSINLLGMNDIAKYCKPNDFILSYVKYDRALDEVLKNIDREKYSILLSHRPELFDIYAFHNIDLVLCGHAHGGFIRLPIIGGIFAPNQGMFPKYTRGGYNKDNLTMLVNRGLGDSLIPVRLLNRPEIKLIILRIG